jgi:hypothetical protein
MMPAARSPNGPTFAHAMFSTVERVAAPSGC